MDVLQRLQNWFTMHCNGDWEHDHGIQLKSLDNPGWWLRINLRDTNLQHAVLPHSLVERTGMDWVSLKIEDGYYDAAGGPSNLSEIILYFLDTLLPQQGNSGFEYLVHIPLTEYPGLIWRRANAVFINEQSLRITGFPNPEESSSYIISGEDAYEAFAQLAAGSLADASTIAQIGDVIRIAIEEHQFSTDLVYAGHQEQ